MRRKNNEEKIPPVAENKGSTDGARKRVEWNSTRRMARSIAIGRQDGCSKLVNNQDDFTRHRFAFKNQIWSGRETTKAGTRPSRLEEDS